MTDTPTPTKKPPPKRRQGQHVDASEWHDAFLANFSRLGVVNAACQAVGIHRSTAYQHRKVDPAFAERWEAAEEDAADVLEQVAQAWGTTGLPERTTTTQTLPDGTVTVTVKESSSRSPFLLGLLLKARRPEKFRERYEMTTTESPIAYDFSKLSPDELATVYDKLAKAAVNVELGTNA